MQPQLLRCAAAQEHAVHENFKIFDHRAHLRVDGKRQADLLLRQRDLVLFDGVIHAVVNIKRRAGLLAHTVRAHVHFIRQNERRGHGVDREGGLFVVIADGGDDGGRLLRACTHLIEDTERHDRAGLRMVNAVDDVSDVVQPARDGSQLARAVVIAQRLQNGARLRRDKAHVGEAVLRKAQRGQRFVRLADVACDLLAFLDLFERDRHRRASFLFIDWPASCRSASAEAPPAWQACRL